MSAEHFSPQRALPHIYKCSQFRTKHRTASCTPYYNETYKLYGYTQRAWRERGLLLQEHLNIPVTHTHIDTHTQTHTSSVFLFSPSHTQSPSVGTDSGPDSWVLIGQGGAARAAVTRLAVWGVVGQAPPWGLSNGPRSPREPPQWVSRLI